MMTRVDQVLLAAAGGLAAMLAIQLGVAAQEREARPILIASWFESPASLEETAGSAEEVVRARVTRVRPGADIVVNLPQEPGGEDRIPTEVVTLRVEKVYKGPAGGPPETVEVFHLGRSNGQEHIAALEDPPYAQGQEYVLFLKRGPDVRVGGSSLPTRRVVSPHGRYRIQRGRMEPMSQMGWAAQHRGRPVDQFEADVTRGIQQSAGRRPGV